MLLDDRSAKRKAKAGPRFFRRIERVENTLHFLRSDAKASIAYFKKNVVAALRSRADGYLPPSPR